MKVLLFTVIALLVVNFSNAQGKKKGHDKHHHHDHKHDKKKKPKKKKHHHDKHCHSHHHDYTNVVIDNPNEQAVTDAKTLGVSVGLNTSQKSGIEKAYLNFYLNLNKTTNLDEEQRNKKCKELEKKRDTEVQNVLKENQLSIYTNFIKSW
ncbi:hypothetical protein EI427_04920 [Flammeovirga pectinis]|uniref:Uncharacterized protein n=1 Tax=Flammeovirga pectinis TaxID=2494373 RepID=A0A3S9P083_9BACT|nr:hypothetical protein [Flammeovirga pectinis]AZQ61594.1 hypothetical protein EI427_04920 [Flammeovirga pectinis]